MSKELEISEWIGPEDHMLQSVLEIMNEVHTYCVEQKIADQEEEMSKAMELLISHFPIGV